MSYKHLLKFYFFADGLNKALDDLCLRFAFASADSNKGCAYYAEKIGGLIEAKIGLGGLWAFLDGAISSMTESDRRVLKEYSVRRGRSSNIKKESAGEREKALHRALMKFSRRVSGRLERYAEQVNVLREYYCLVAADLR